MLLGSKHKIKKTRHYPLCINNENIDYVISYKYLGVTIDQTLSFNLHMNQLIKTVSYELFLLQKLRFYITCQALFKFINPWYYPILIMAMCYIKILVPN